MRDFTRFSTLRLITGIVLLGVGLASAQISPEQRQAILDYPLTMSRANQLLAAMVPMTQYLASLPDYQERLRKSATMSSAARLNAVETDPKAMAILRQNGLTARDYLIGVSALRMAILAAQGRSSPMIIASPANIAFAKANLAEIKPRMNAADGVGAATK